MHFDSDRHTAHFSPSFILLLPTVMNCSLQGHLSKSVVEPATKARPAQDKPECFVQISSACSHCALTIVGVGELSISVCV